MESSSQAAAGGRVASPAAAHQRCGAACLPLLRPEVPAPPPLPPDARWSHWPRPQIWGAMGQAGVDAKVGWRAGPSRAWKLHGASHAACGLMCCTPCYIGCRTLIKCPPHTHTNRALSRSRSRIAASCTASSLRYAATSPSSEAFMPSVTCTFVRVRLWVRARVCMYVCVCVRVGGWVGGCVGVWGVGVWGGGWCVCVWGGGGTSATGQNYCTLTRRCPSNSTLTRSACLAVAFSAVVRALCSLQGWRAW